MLLLGLIAPAALPLSYGCAIVAPGGSRTRDLLGMNEVTDIFTTAAAMHSLGNRRDCDCPFRSPDALTLSYGGLSSAGEELNLATFGLAK